MTIFAGNLPFSMKEDDLNRLFSEFGTVQSAKIITDRMSGRSKGYGFIEMDDASEVNAAIDALNEKEVNGRALKINIAKPRE